MKRLCWAAALLLLAGCGIQPSTVSGAGQAPTGIAPGMTLYFLDADRELRPELRETGRLGTISEAMVLLLLGPSSYSHLSTGIASIDDPQVAVTVTETTIQLRVPLAAKDVTRLGAEQIVCTALASHVQRGGSRAATVQILFTIPSAGSDRPRTCPVIR
jgi:hypothetical protein